MKSYAEDADVHRTVTKFMLLNCKEELYCLYSRKLWSSLL